MPVTPPEFISVKGDSYNIPGSMVPFTDKNLMSSSKKRVCWAIDQKFTKGLFGSIYLKPQNTSYEFAQWLLTKSFFKILFGA